MRMIIVPYLPGFWWGSTEIIYVKALAQFLEHSSYLIDVNHYIYSSGSWLIKGYIIIWGRACYTRWANNLLRESSRRDELCQEESQKGQRKWYGNWTLKSESCFSGRKWGKRRDSRWREDLQWHKVTEVWTCLEEGDNSGWSLRRHCSRESIGLSRSNCHL